MKNEVVNINKDTLIFMFDQLYGYYHIIENDHDAFDRPIALRGLYQTLQQFQRSVSLIWKAR